MHVCMCKLDGEVQAVANTERDWTRARQNAFPMSSLLDNRRRCGPPPAGVRMCAHQQKNPRECDRACAHVGMHSA